jgi:hypothetical protein
MKPASIGLMIMIAGIGVITATTLAQKDADLKGIPLNQTSFGAIVGPINKNLPIPGGAGLGLTIIGGIMWLLL